eukprot:gene8409-234_t
MSEVLCNVCNENPATKYCNECKVNAQCDECSSFFHKKKINQNHAVMEYSEWLTLPKPEKGEEIKKKEETIPTTIEQPKGSTNAKNKCPKHNTEEVKLYCEECRRIVCLLCLTGDHNGHVCKNFSDVVEPFLEELAEEKKIFEDKTEYYQKILDKVVGSTEKIKREKQEKKDKIQETFENLRKLLQEKENELYEHVDNHENSKLNKLGAQTNQLKNTMRVLETHINIAQEIEYLKSDTDQFEFISQSLQQCETMKYFKFEDIQEEPVCFTGDERDLDVMTLEEQIEKVELSPPIDFTKSTLAPRSKFVHVAKKNGFLLLLKNSEGNPITLEPQYQLKAKVISGPEGYVAFVGFNKSSKPGRIHFIFEADLVGDYKVKIHWNDIEFEGSPFEVCVRPNLGQPIDLLIQPTQAIHFYVKTEEFCMASKKSVTTYDVTGKKLRSYNLPVKASFISSDSLGHYFISDGDKTFYKFDSEFNEIKQWKPPLNKGEYVCAVSASQDDEYFFGMTSSGKVLKFFRDDSKGFYKTCFQLMDFSPDTVGNMLVYDDLFIISDKTVKVYDRKGVMRQQFTEFTEGAVFSVVYDQVYACGTDSKIWSTLYLAPDWEKQKKKKTTPTDPSNRTLQSQSSSGRISILSFMQPKIVNQSIQDIDSISKIKAQSILPADSKINSICIGPAGESIITGGKKIIVWDYDHGGQVESEIDVSANIVCTNGNCIISTFEKTVQIHDIVHSELLKEFNVEEEVSVMEITEDGKKIVCGLKNGKIFIFDFENPSISKNIGKHGDCIHSLVLSQDSQFIFTGSTDSNLKIWSFEKGDLHTLKGHQSAITAIALADGSRTLISGSATGSMRIWSTESLKCVKVINKAHKDQITALKITPNEKFVVSTSFETNVVKIHKIETGSERTSSSVGKKEINTCLAVDPNGKYFATGTDRGVAIWQNVKYTSLNDEKNISSMSKNSSFMGSFRL